MSSLLKVFLFLLKIWFQDYFGEPKQDVQYVNAYKNLLRLLDLGKSIVLEHHLIQERQRQCMSTSERDPSAFWSWWPYLPLPHRPEWTALGSVSLLWFSLSRCVSRRTRQTTCWAHSPLGTGHNRRRGWGRWHLCTAVCQLLLLGKTSSPTIYHF